MFLKNTHKYLAPADDKPAGGAAADLDELAGDRGDELDPEDDDGGVEDTFEAKKEEPAKAAAKKEEPADDDDADDKPAAKKPQMIPKVRFDQARQKDKERIRQLEAELAKGRSTEPPASKKIADLEQASSKLSDDYAKALEDGDTKKATELMGKIRANDREIVRMESALTSARDREIAVEQVRLDMLIDKLEEDYPQLKDGTDEYDEDLVTEIGELRAAFEARGYSSSDSLKKAVKYVLREDGAGSARQIEKDVDEAAVEADKAADKAATKADKAKQLAAERKAEAVRRNIQVAKKTPADTSKGPGVDSHKAGGDGSSEDVNRMTDADFDALPEATKAKLRGDFYDAAA